MSFSCEPISSGERSNISRSSSSKSSYEKAKKNPTLNTHKKKTPEKSQQKKTFEKCIFYAQINIFGKIFFFITIKWNLIFFDDVNCFGRFDRSWKTHKLQLEHWTWQFRRTVRGKKINCLTTICGPWFLCVFFFSLVAENHILVDDCLCDKTKNKKRTTRTRTKLLLLLFSPHLHFIMMCIWKMDAPMWESIFDWCEYNYNQQKSPRSVYIKRQQQTYHSH